MTDSLDNILARTPAEAAPAQETTQETTEQQEQQVASSEATAETPTQETASGEGKQEQQKLVPHEALHAEKQKVKRYTEQVSAFEQQLREQNEAWERRFTTLVEKLGPKPEPAPQVDWYTDPDAAMKQNLGQALSPIERKFADLEFRLVKMNAESKYGADKVREFETYVEDAARRGDPEIQALAVEMRSSPDPIGVGLKWYEKKTFDPVAERERLKAELLEELKSQNTQTPTNPAVMPSNLAGARNVGNRSGPQWGGPPTLNDIFKR